MPSPLDLQQVPCSPRTIPELVPSTPKSSLSGGLTGKLLNGAVAGITGTLVIYPLDMVKTRLQSQKPNPAGKLPYSSGADCARKILRHEGTRGFYRGLGPNLVGITPEKAIKLGVNDYVRGKLAVRYGCNIDALPTSASVIAGATAGFSQVIATNPMEIVKIRMQVAGLRRVHVTAGEVVRELGIRGLYKGTCATLLRDVPFSIIFFPLHARLRYMSRGADGKTTFAGTFWSGVVSGAVAGAAVTPADVIKTRLQSANPAKPYPGVLGCCKSIIRKEGVGALFKGAGWRAAIVSPLFSIALLMYEVQQTLLGTSA